MYRTILRKDRHSVIKDIKVYICFILLVDILNFYGNKDERNESIKD